MPSTFLRVRLFLLVFRQLAQARIELCGHDSERLALGAQSLAVELASNDGYLLQYFVKKGIPVLGVEPAVNVAKVAEQKGVPTLVKFFGCQTARQMVADGQAADLIIGNNVLAQVRISTISWAAFELSSSLAESPLWNFRTWSDSWRRTSTIPYIMSTFPISR